MRRRLLLLPQFSGETNRDRRSGVGLILNLIYDAGVLQKRRQRGKTAARDGEKSIPFFRATDYPRLVIHGHPHDLHHLRADVSRLQSPGEYPWVVSRRDAELAAFLELNFFHL